MYLTLSLCKFSQNAKITNSKLTSKIGLYYIAWVVKSLYIHTYFWLKFFDAFIIFGNLMTLSLDIFGEAFDPNNLKWIENCLAFLVKTTLSCSSDVNNQSWIYESWFFFLRVPIQQEIEFNLFSNCESKQRYSKIVHSGLV